MELRNADRVMEEIRKPLAEVFNEYVVIGLRKLEDHEDRKVDETSERPYWFVSGSPVMGGALVNWALRSIMAQMHNDGTLNYLDPETGEMKKLPMADVIKKLTEET